MGEHTAFLDLVHSFPRQLRCDLRVPSWRGGWDAMIASIHDRIKPQVIVPTVDIYRLHSTHTGVGY